MKSIEPHKLTPKDVADVLGISVDQVYELIEAKQIAAIDVSKGNGRAAWRISESAVVGFIDRRRTDGTGQSRPSPV
jgi:excisionase family DNA binding protein